MIPAVNLSLGKKIIASPLFWVFIALVFVFGAGYLTGRLTTPKPKPFEIISTPIEQPSPMGGAGILVPESPAASAPALPSAPCSMLLQWHRFDDTLITIRCRAERADSIEYRFKKRWYEFTPQEPYVTSLLVYGVAPESIKVHGTLPISGSPDHRFSIILTATTQPSANLLFGYRGFILHLQYHRDSDPQITDSPALPVTGSFYFGIGYHFRF